MSEPSPNAKAKPSGSNKRRRKHVVNITLDDAEFELTRERAGVAGLSLAAFARASMLGSPGPRARRMPPLNTELFAYAIAQLNRVGSNLNQLTRRLNAGYSTELEEAVAALRAVRDAAAEIRRLAGRTDRRPQP